MAGRLRVLLALRGTGSDRLPNAQRMALRRIRKGSTPRVRSMRELCGVFNLNWEYVLYGDSACHSVFPELLENYRRATNKFPWFVRMVSEALITLNRWIPGFQLLGLKDGATAWIRKELVSNSIPTAFILEFFMAPNGVCFKFFMQHGKISGKFTLGACDEFGLTNCVAVMQRYMQKDPEELLPPPMQLNRAVQIGLIKHARN